MSDDRIIPTTQPTDLVTYTVKVNGNEVPRTILITSIIVEQEINKIPWAKLSIIDGDGSISDFTVSDQDLFVPGNTIEIFRSEERRVGKEC